MVKFVVKKDGAKEPFDAQKIRKAIEAVAQRTSFTSQRIAEVKEEVLKGVMEAIGEREEVAATEIRGEVLAKLDKIEPSVSEAWRKYDAEKGKM